MAGTVTITKPSTVVLVSVRSPGGATPGWIATSIIGGIPTTDSTDPTLINGLILGLIGPDVGIVSYSSEFETSANIIYGFDIATNIFSLDGLPAVDFNHLPPGFVLTALNLQLHTSLNNSDSISLTINGITQTITQPPDADGTFNINIIPVGVNLNPLTFIGYQINITNLFPSVGSFTQMCVLDSYSLTGTYDIVASGFSPAIENTTPVRVGDKIIIDSALPGLNDVDIIRLTYPGHVIDLVLDPENPRLIIDDVIYYWLNFVFVQTEFQLQFYLPFGFSRFSGSVTVTLIGDGTQFSGSVVAGVLQILFADASGIYRLEEGQASDVLYFRDGYTTDVKFLMLDFEDEVFDDNYFSIKQERLRMLAQNDFDYEDFEYDNFSVVSVLRIPVITRETEIPSPFIITSFLP